MADFFKPLVSSGCYYPGMSAATASSYFSYYGHMAAGNAAAAANGHAGFQFGAAPAGYGMSGGEAHRGFGLSPTSASSLSSPFATDNATKYDSADHYASSSLSEGQAEGVNVNGSSAFTSLCSDPSIEAGVHEKALISSAV